MSCKRSRYFSSSRMPGSAKSCAGERLAPRSRPTTESPALVSSRAMMLPVQPMPTSTASTCFSFLAMACPSAEIGDGLGFDADLLPAIGFGLVGPGRGQAGIADHAPGDLVAVAAIHRIGEEAFHGRLQHGFEEGLRFDALELRRALFHGGERGGAVRLREAVEILAVGFARPGIGGPDAGGEIFARRQRQLVAMFGPRGKERAVAVEARAIAPGARELAGDIGDEAAITAPG